MKRTKEPVWMGAAECARRTGLTVRTLRIYERHALIEPMRSDKGWRCYGPKELQRLNVIVTLKALGMTLEQIRMQLATNPRRSTACCTCSLRPAARDGTRPTEPSG